MCFAKPALGKLLWLEAKYGILNSLFVGKCRYATKMQLRLTLGTGLNLLFLAVAPIRFMVAA
jgi:hypothetical protein